MTLAPEGGVTWTEPTDAAWNVIGEPACPERDIVNPA